MRSREVTLKNGTVLQVPSNIQRIECRGTRGWQVRYVGTKFFADGKHSPRSSLKAAKAELAQRIQNHQAPNRLGQTIPTNKRSQMPLGITGPLVRKRASGIMECNISVSVPKFGGKPQRRTVYVGNQTTFSERRLDAAVKRAVKIRADAEEAYRVAATAARREEMRHA